MPLPHIFLIVKWARDICLRDFGSEVGEKVFRSLTAKEVLFAWPTRTLYLA